MSRLLLHIGTNKTGSTSIQRCLRGMGSDVFRYPDLNGSAGHGAVLLPFVLCESLPRIKREQCRSMGVLRRMAGNAVIRRRLGRHLESDDPMILSAENLWNVPPESIGRIRSFIERHGNREVSCLVYVRDPRGYYLSLAQQALKGGPLFPKPEELGYRFREAIADWEREFPGRIRVRSYDAAAGNGGSVVRDFLAEASESLGVDIGVSEPPARSNESVSAEEMILLQAALLRAGAPIGRSPSASRDIRGNLAGIFGEYGARPTKPRLKRDVEECLDRLYGADVDAVNERYGTAIPRGPGRAGEFRRPEVDRSDVRSVLESWDESLVEEVGERLRELGF